MTKLPTTPRSNRLPLAAAAALGLIVALAAVIAPAPAARADLPFYRTLKHKGRASLGDAVRVFHGISRDLTEEVTLEEAARELIDAEMMPEEWLDDLEDPVSLGGVSYLTCTTLQIDGGLSMRIFGPSRRACYREAVHRRLVAPLGPHRYVSGADLLAIARRAKRHKRLRAGEEELAEIPDPERDAPAREGESSAERRSYDD